MSAVCTQPGCPNLRPCPTHSRPRNIPWSTGRDRAAQRRFRNQVLARDHQTCTRCGHHDPTGRTLEAHHLRPGNHPDNGTTLCTKEANGCHATIDPHAR